MYPNWKRERGYIISIPASLAPLQLVSEGEGFEPPVSCPTAAFKAATIDLSDILP